MLFVAAKLVADDNDDDDVVDAVVVVASPILMMWQRKLQPWAIRGVVTDLLDYCLDCWHRHYLFLLLGFYFQKDLHLRFPK